MLRYIMLCILQLCRVNSVLFVELKSAFNLVDFTFRILLFMVYRHEGIWFKNRCPRYQENVSFDDLE